MLEIPAKKSLDSVGSPYLRTYAYQKSSTNSYVKIRIRPGPEGFGSGSGHPRVRPEPEGSGSGSGSDPKPENASGPGRIQPLLIDLFFFLHNYFDPTPNTISIFYVVRRDGVGISILLTNLAVN
jgi:hypothetical protein